MKKLIKASLSADEIKDWYRYDTYMDPKRLEQSLGIEWDINIEDVECVLDDPIDLTDIKSVRYLNAKQLDEVIEKGYEGGYVVTYNDGTVKTFAWRPYPDNLGPIEEVSITASVGPWKVKYQVHWISPDGNDCLLGGSNNIEEANRIAEEQARHIFESPFETPERKHHFLDTLYIVDLDTERDAMLTDTEDAIDSLMSELDSKIVKSSTVAASDKPVKLKVEFYPYERYESTGLRRATISGKDLRSALLKMVDRLGLYLTKEEAEEEGYTAEEIIDRIQSENGDGCDYITYLADTNSGTVYIQEDYEEEEDWD